jgi:hypothetical protein
MESELYSRKVMIESMASYIINRMNILNVLSLELGEKVTYSKYIINNKIYRITATKVKNENGNFVICGYESEEGKNGYLSTENVEIPLNGDNEFQFQILSDIINAMDIVYGRYFTIGYFGLDGNFLPIVKEKSTLKFDDYDNAKNYAEKIQKNYKHKLEIKRL